METLARVAEPSAGADGEVHDTTTRRQSPLDVLRLRDFRLLWIGSGIAVLGDQFYLVALPWLVLQLTGSALAMGTVLAVAGIPRALFMLLGGALTDRLSPRTVMLASALLRLTLVAGLAALVYAGAIQTWMLYALALVFGTVDAFSFPAGSAMVPRLVAKDQLQTANALVQGTAQLSVFLGPVLAGGLIALLDGARMRQIGSAVDARGIAAAFAVDAVGFLVAAATLWLMRAGRTPARAEADGPTGGVLGDIVEGLAAVWRDAPLRTFFLIVAAVNLLTSGPVVVGIPAIAATRLPEGVAAFGIIMSAWGGGSLLGIVLAGALPKPSSEQMGRRLLLVTSALGVGLVLLGLSASTPLAATVGLGMGAANGYVVIQFMTWFQARTPARMLGRMMSLLMFAVVGLMPVSTAVAGALADLNATALFVVAGCLLTAIVLAAAASPSVREMTAEPVEA